MFQGPGQLDGAGEGRAGRVVVEASRGWRCTRAACVLRPRAGPPAAGLRALVPLRRLSLAPAGYGHCRGCRRGRTAVVFLTAGLGGRPLDKERRRFHGGALRQRCASRHVGLPLAAAAR
eukprot:3216952-Pyramimonas_sp.AAC.1